MSFTCLTVSIFTFSLLLTNASLLTRYSQFHISCFDGNYFYCCLSTEILSPLNVQKNNILTTQTVPYNFFPFNLGFRKKLHQNKK